MSGSNCNPLNWSWATLSKVLATTAILFYLAYLYRLGYAKNPEQEYEGSWWNDYQLATGRLNKGRKEFLDRMGTKLTSYVHKATGYRPDETWSTEVVEFIEVVKLTPGLSNGLKSKTGLGGLMVAGSVISPWLPSYSYCAGLPLRLCSYMYRCCCGSADADPVAPDAAASKANVSDEEAGAKANKEDAPNGQPAEASPDANKDAPNANVSGKEESVLGNKSQRRRRRKPLNVKCGKKPRNPLLPFPEQTRRRLLESVQAA